MYNDSRDGLHDMIIYVMVVVCLLLSSNHIYETFKLLRYSGHWLFITGYENYFFIGPNIYKQKLIKIIH